MLRRVLMCGLVVDFWYLLRGGFRGETWIYHFYATLEAISSLSHSIIFLYFFALIIEEGFLISPCCSLELCIQMGIFFPFPLCLSSLLFSAICKASSDNHFAFLHFFFLRMVLIPASCAMSWTSIHSSSGTLSDLILWICLSLPLYNDKGFDLGHTWMVFSPLLFPSL